MKKSQLINVMKYHLKNLKTSSIKIDKKTIHNSALESNDGYGALTSKNLYQSMINYTIWRNLGLENLDWPIDWIDKSVEELADYFISIINKQEPNTN